MFNKEKFKTFIYNVDFKTYLKKSNIDYLDGDELFFSKTSYFKKIYKEKGDLYKGKFQIYLIIYIYDPENYV